MAHWQGPQTRQHFDNKTSFSYTQNQPRSDLGEFSDHTHNASGYMLCTGLHVADTGQLSQTNTATALRNPSLYCLPTRVNVYIYTHSLYSPFLPPPRIIHTLHAAWIYTRAMTHSWYVFLRELVCSVGNQKTGLSYCSVANHYALDRLHGRNSSLKSQTREFIERGLIVGQFSNAPSTEPPSRAHPIQHTFGNGNMAHPIFLVIFSSHYL